MEKEYKGNYGMVVTLTDNAIIINREKCGIFHGRELGNKTIPYSSVVAVQMKQPTTFSVGYLQLSIRGGAEAKGGIFQAVNDENTMVFGKWALASFEEVKATIEARMGEHGTKVQPNPLDDLEKLSELKDKGIITQDEFDQKKKLLLGL